MNRPIKFRYWDTKNNRFDTDIGVYIISGIDLANSTPEGYEITQFTGLKDKNGVDIYEGDLCKVHDFNVEIVEIRYRENVAAFQGYQPGFENTFKNLWLEPNGDYYEVVGNIYQDNSHDPQ